MRFLHSYSEHWNNSAFLNESSPKFRLALFIPQWVIGIIWMQRNVMWANYLALGIKSKDFHLDFPSVSVWHPYKDRETFQEIRSSDELMQTSVTPIVTGCLSLNSLHVLEWTFYWLCTTSCNIKIKIKEEVQVKFKANNLWSWL